MDVDYPLSCMTGDHDECEGCGCSCHGYACGHAVRTQGCGGCDPGAIAFELTDGQVALMARARQVRELAELNLADPEPGRSGEPPAIDEPGPAAGPEGDPSR